MAIDLTTTFQAMADPTRRAILAQLATGALPVADLARPLAMTAPAVSHHLKVLENAGLVHRRIVGQQRIMSLAPDRIERAETWLRDLRKFWDERFDALETHLKSLD
ncbi:MAG: ArsR/SmtB family transcription factor [Alphaproteobacteria bacterium]